MNQVEIDDEIISGECSREEFVAFIRSLGFEDEGWITETGEFLACDEYMKHGYIASCVLGCNEIDGEAEADKRGWLRLSDYGTRTAAKRLNQRQLNTLFDWCEHHKCDYHEVLGRIEYL